MIIKGNNYLSVRELQTKLGLATPIPIKMRLKRGSIPGAIKWSGRWLIPADTILDDRRYTDGKYIAWRKRYGKNKREASQNG